jgi:hypothetical protein
MKEFLYFNAIHDGRVLDEATGKLADVRDDQVVSRWDLDTGPTSMLGMFDVNLDRVFKNNKLGTVFWIMPRYLLDLLLIWLLT